MAAKKKTAKKKAKKKVAKKATTKKKVAKKKASPKKTNSKKTVAKKKASKKKVSKVSKKTVTKKKSTVKKKTTTTKKKTVSKTKPTSAKKASAKSTATKKNKGKMTKVTELKTKQTTSKTKRIIAPYQEKKGEEYMSQEQLEHFREILLNWKHQLIEEADKTVHHMQEEAANFADPSDRATQEEEFGLELRTRDRERKLLRKINAALSRIEDGSYGYCEDTGEEIGVRRLEARPVATLCLEAQQRREMAKGHYRDSADIDR